MENKYYTPDISELYVGYQCEINNCERTKDKYTIEYD